MNAPDWFEKLYIIYEEDGPSNEKVFGYYLDPYIAKSDVLWLKALGINARIEINKIDTRKL